MSAPLDATLPPQDLEAERALLSALLLDAIELDDVAALVQPRDFYRVAHQLVFGAMLRLSERGDAVDVATVGEELRAGGEMENAGGPAGVAAIAGAVPSAALALAHARIVRDRSWRRHLLAGGQGLASMAYGDHESPEAMLDAAEVAVSALRERIKSADAWATVKSGVAASIAETQKAHEAGGPTEGTTTGFEDLDAMTCGLMPGDLAIVAARPSMGKTALALNIALHVAGKVRRPVAFFELEMTVAQLCRRALASSSGVDATRLRTGALAQRDWDHMSHAIGKLMGGIPLSIDDTAALTVAEIRSRTRRLAAREKGLGLVVVDHLQLVRPGTQRADNRHLELSAITKGLKALAKEMACPVICLSQLNRGVEARGDKRPMMSDLRESGAIEEDADLVAFIYRDEVYHPQSDDKGIAEIIVAKQRNGPIGTVKLGFNAACTRFNNLTQRAA